MCLFIESGPHVADRDIKVLKIIDSHNYSTKRGFLYTANQCQQADSPLLAQPTTWFDNYNSFDSKTKIESGFHSFNLERIKAVTLSKSKLTGKPIHILELPGGKESFGEKINRKAVFFYIPKGATYYIGSRGDLASDKIRSGSLKAIRPRDLRKFIKSK